MLTRVHEARFIVTDFNPTVAEKPTHGGRFDGTPEDGYAFLYAASDDATAVSEALLRDIPIDDGGARSLLATRLRGRRFGWLRTTCELQLVNLRSGVDLAAIGQDTRLTNAPAGEYVLTRQWAVAIRDWAKWAQGFTWRSRREPDGYAYVFFGDRAAGPCLEEARDGMPLPPDERNIDAGFGRLYVEELLSRYRVTLI
ncbi:MAG: RES family NAD+ phosphorylase [Chloroflexi bacterium]|nr:RES family NAD+ phosphorylase [Chloroflexota bacterium]